MIEKVKTLFRNRFGAAPLFIARAPGRVNLLGEHVDYNDGFVLPAAIDRASYLAFSPADSEQTTLVAADLAEEVCFGSYGLSAKKQVNGSSLPDWALYPAGVMWSLNEAGYTTQAMNGVLISDVPRGAGLSSSASVEMAFGVAWQQLGGWQILAMQMAQIGQRAENAYVGVNCGIMDQFASACGVANQLLLLDCRSLNWQTLPIPARATIVIADTSVRRKLTTSGYNERRMACQEAVRILSQELIGIQSLRDVSVESFNQLAHQLPAIVEKRARHVVEEIERTQLAVPLLAQGNIEAFGQIMNACHSSLRDLYEVSTPELNTMVKIAQQLKGCFGARLTGAGFGGCTVNLVEKEAAAAFASDLAVQYQQATGLEPKVYICHASDGANIIN